MTFNTLKSRNVLEKIDSLIVRQVHFGHSNYYRNIHSFVICVQRIIHYAGYFKSAFIVGFGTNR